MRFSFLPRAVAAAVLSLASIALHAQNVAIVNGKAVPKSRLNMLAAQLERSGRSVTPDMEQQLREEVIMREIFMQEAEKQSLDGSDDYKIQLELAKQSILIRELFNQYQKANPISEADVKAEYDKFIASSSGKEYRARHILVEKEDQAKAIIASLKKGGKQSKDPGSGANGGDLDWANPGSFVKEFSQAMVSLKKGQITDTAVKTQFGFHIIRLDDTRETPVPKFDEVKPQILQQMQQGKLAEYQQSLREKAKIE
jgi:peptidyl-prolyl cis-trans isomerase C